MKIEFEPFSFGVKKNEFSASEFEVSEDPKEGPVLTEQQEFLVECERLKQEAVQQGYAEGIAQAQAEIDEKKLILDKWLKLIQKPVQLLDDQLVQEIIQAVIWICTHCIGVELSVHPEKLQALLHEIKDELPALKGNTHISMHPEDIVLAKNELANVLMVDLDEKLVPDPNLNRGDFYLKGENTELDGRIHTRFATLFAKYLDKDSFITPQTAQE
ncbi:MAG: flagellar assembly protein FliH [Legionella sp.]|nr:MAG: flagellar assembly protein FliH [Legionella sp.]